MTSILKEDCRRSTPIRVRKRRSPIESESDEDERREPVRKTPKPTIIEEPNTLVYAKKSGPLIKPEAAAAKPIKSPESQDLCEVVATCMPPTPPTPPTSSSSTANQPQKASQQNQEQQESSSSGNIPDKKHTCLVAQLALLIDSHNKFIENVRRIFSTLANQPDGLCRTCCDKFEPNAAKNHSST